MLDLRIVADGRAFTLEQAVAQLGAFDATREIGRLIEVMIAKLDELQGDVDLEDDDPSHDTLDDGENNDPVAIPIYGEDQSAGPTNIAQAERAHRLSLFAVPTASRRAVAH
jgi:hypothetical protein